MSSFDQFSNLVLTDTVERRIVTVREEVGNISDGGEGQLRTTTVFRNYYHDHDLGLYIVRGDSMVLTGAVPNSNDVNAGGIGTAMRMMNMNSPPGTATTMEAVSLAELERLSKQAEPVLRWDFDEDLIA
jgi:small nuclear ribonucleoprotein (snRNP)-like protein